MQEQEKEIFQNYEIKNWEYAPRFYKILAAAAILNLLALLVVGSTNLLTRKGCDSPFVNRVCQVLDTVYVGSILLGTDTAYVDKDYQKTELEDADITFIEMPNEKPFAYPEGYFAPSADELAMMQNPVNDFSTTNIPGITANPTFPPGGTDLLATPQVTPPPTKNIITGGMPTSPLGNYSGVNPIPAPSVKGMKPRRMPSARQPKLSNIPPTKLPSLGGDNAMAENKPNDKKPDSTQPEIKSDPVAGVEINKKPFEDLGDTIIDKVEKKEVDLSKNFVVVLDGTITSDGKLDTKKSKFIKWDGDEQMVNVAKKTIEAVGYSGFLAYLKNAGVDRVNFVMVQDDQQIYIKIISEQKTPERAATTASQLNGALSTARVFDENGLTKLDDNAKILLSNSKVTSEGKNFVLNFALPKQNAQDIITRTLQQYAEKKAKQQPNSTAQTTNGNLKTAR